MIEIERVRASLERRGDRLLQRLFTPQEIAEVGDQIQSLAGRFAAKEAVAKAFSTGIGDISWQEIEIRRGPNREPVLCLSGEARKLSDQLGITDWSLSISHSHSHAIAFVVALGKPG
jgi:holo-[acyl-carrier protein] synthase